MVENIKNWCKNHKNCWKITWIGERSHELMKNHRNWWKIRGIDVVRMSTTALHWITLVNFRSNLAWMLFFAGQVVWARRGEGRDDKIHPHLEFRSNLEHAEKSLDPQMPLMHPPFIKSMDRWADRLITRLVPLLEYSSQLEWRGWGRNEYSKTPGRKNCSFFVYYYYFE